jgi:hypothetical protein
LPGSGRKSACGKCALAVLIPENVINSPSE